MKRRLVWLVWAIRWVVNILAIGISVYAQQSDAPDNFQIEVSPSNFKINQPVDMTVTAIKNGQVMRWYKGTFYISVEENGKSMFSDVTLPDSWVWNIDLTDQWVKTYTKGLTIKKAGTYKVIVEDIMDESRQWETTINVISDGPGETENIEILSPIQNVTESNSKLDVIAMAATIPNSQMEVFLNNVSVGSGMSDEGWFFNITVPLTQLWTNTLEIRATSRNWQLVGRSSIVTFLYDKQEEELFKSRSMTPTEKLELWMKASVTLKTAESVSSAILHFGASDYPMDWESKGNFSKDFTLQETWDLKIWFDLIVDNLSNPYPDKGVVNVRDNIKIWAVKLVADPTEQSLINLSWEVIGATPDEYAIYYWYSASSLEARTYTKNQEIALSWFTYGQTYYFQIYPVTSEHLQDWVESKVIDYTFPIPKSDPVCGNWVPEEGETCSTCPADLECEPEAVCWNGIEEEWETCDTCPEDLECEPKAVCWNGIIEEGESCESCAEDVWDCEEHPLPACVVKNIQFTTEKIWNKYYMVWNEVENATKYLIYRSEYEDNSDKQFIGETEIPRYEYPFDNTSEEEVYAYFTIEALCTDWDVVVIAEAEKVQVWPFEDMILILMTTFLFYLMYKLYTYRMEY